MTGAFLLDTPRRVHRHWWTVVPALPSGPDTHEARVLKRVWFDHTMNTFRKQPDGALLPGGRGFYTEGTEDHITPAIFQTWAALGPGQGWLPGLLGLFGLAAEGPIETVRWSYFFEEYGPDGKRPIADIVVAWKDGAGSAVLVIEAKRPKAKLSRKDLTDLGRYLRMPTIAAVARRHLGLLVDQADVSRARSELGNAWPVTSWQSLVAAQILSAQSTNASGTVRSELSALIAAHAKYHDLLELATVPKLQIIRGDGTAGSFSTIAQIPAPPPIACFLLGSEAAMAARSGRNPTPPMEWLAQSQTVEQIWRARQQSTADRQVPLWRVDRRA